MDGSHGRWLQCNRTDWQRLFMNQRRVYCSGDTVLFSRRPHVLQEGAHNTHTHTTHVTHTHTHTHTHVTCVVTYTLTHSDFACYHVLYNTVMSLKQASLSTRRGTLDDKRSCFTNIVVERTLNNNKHGIPLARKE